MNEAGAGADAAGAEPVLKERRGEHRENTVTIRNRSLMQNVKKMKTMPVETSDGKQVDGEKRLSERDKIIIKRISYIFNIHPKKQEKDDTIESEKTDSSFNSTQQKDEFDTRNSKNDEIDVFEPNEEKKKILEYKRKHVIPKVLNLLRKNSETDQIEVEEEHEYEFAREMMLNLERSKVQSNFYIEVSNMNVFERTRVYEDPYPYLQIRKKFLFLKRLISFLCQKIIKHPIFEFCTLLIILVNSIFLALDDPLIDQPSQISETADFVFLILYTIEMGLKVFGMGLVLDKKSYLREAWNILDFIIIFSAYIPYFFSQKTINLSILRSFRILRPLRAISSVKKLRSLLVGLFNALPLLKDTLIILLFFYIIFAIAFLNLFQGVMMRRCFEAATGKLSLLADGTTQMCHDTYVCANNYICGKMLENPNWGITNFDSFPSSILMVFQTVTLEGWTDIMISLEKTFSPWVVLAFVVMVFVGAFFIINLTLAVIKVKFSESMKANRSSVAVHSKAENNSYSLVRLRQLGILKERGLLLTSERAKSKGKSKISAVDIVNNLLMMKSKGEQSTRQKIFLRNDANELSQSPTTHESPENTHKFKELVSLSGSETKKYKAGLARTQGFEAALDSVESANMAASPGRDQKWSFLPLHMENIKSVNNSNAKTLFHKPDQKKPRTSLRNFQEARLKTENSDNSTGSKRDLSLTEINQAPAQDEEEAFLREIEENDEVLEENQLLTAHFQSPNILQLKTKASKYPAIEEPKAISLSYSGIKERRAHSERDVHSRQGKSPTQERQVRKEEKNMEVESVSSIDQVSENENPDEKKSEEEGLVKAKEKKEPRANQKFKTSFLEEIQNDSDFIYFDNRVASKALPEKAATSKRTSLLDNSLSRQMSPVRVLMKHFHRPSLTDHSLDRYFKGAV